MVIYQKNADQGCVPATPPGQLRIASLRRPTSPPELSNDLQRIISPNLLAVASILVHENWSDHAVQQTVSVSGWVEGNG
jgi:hypothetical protein